MEKAYMTRKSLIYKENDNVFCFENELFSFGIIYATFLDMFSPNHSYSQPMHSHHSEYEFYMILRGTCHIETNDNKKFIINAGEFIIIPPALKHRITYETGDFSKITLRFTMSTKATEKSNFYSTAENIIKITNVFPYNKQMKDLLSPIIKNATETPHEYKTTVFLHILTFIIEALRVIVGKTKIKSQKKYEDARINSAIEYIKNNISATITVADVAEYIHMSTKQFTRIFTKALGVTPGSYIRDFRIERIRELLTTTNLQIEDIVDIMGYSDSTSLIKAFKRVEGNTPMKYKASII